MDDLFYGAETVEECQTQMTRRLINRIGFVEQDQAITFICFECEFNSEYGTIFQQCTQVSNIHLIDQCSHNN